MKMNKRIVSCLVLVGMMVVTSANDETRDSCQPNADVPATRVNTTARVQKLRTAMQSEGVYALIIPTADDHQNEYVGEHDKKRAFITGFSGSAGTALVTMDDQLLWTDGRYFLQAADELDCNWKLMRSGEKDVPSLTKWIVENVPSDKSIGADAKVISTRSWKLYEETFGRKGLVMQKTSDLVGTVWNDLGGRDAASNNEVYQLNITYAGRTWQQKIADLRNKLKDSKAEALVVSALDEVAWLFNLRGSDIDYNPVFFAYAIVEKETTTSPKLYLRSAATRRASIAGHLQSADDGSCSSANCVKILDYDEVDNAVQAFNDQTKINDTIWISDSTNYHISSLLTNPKRLMDGISPLLLMKAIKNPVERDGMRRAHIRDSAVIVQFISKLEKGLEDGEDWDELKVSEEIDNLRTNQTGNKGLSFTTIAGSGKNGAYIHYTPTKLTNKVVNKDNMLLLDSGGQYLDGTTDITRTFHFGTPTAFQKLAYTLVLLGAIDLAMAKFPANITLGSSLDSLARRPLWERGLDYGHGTGHGIGMFLNVHEGPARVSPKRASTSVSDERAIYDGMFFSDEPGYYDDKKEFGVRLETIVMAAYVETEYGGTNKTLEFEPIALVPFEKNLMNLEMLDNKQRQWLNNYHKLCLEKTGKALKDAQLTEAYDWLEERTAPVPLVGVDVNSSGNTALASIAIITVAFVLTYLK
ncbi:xaa-Pro aminopeptidase 1-like isoform X1 [Watersipora subatra]|uniref:xaa-Pro aminopeptidase 1-like isoform X1 n=1 Tax=Watersipora subatra TaxID=2589382 RepID=UPI00355B018A